MMNREDKTAWIAALRSGDYKQTDGMLCDPIKNRYCCLGVLCVINNVSRKIVDEGSITEFFFR